MVFKGLLASFVHNEARLIFLLTLRFSKIGCILFTYFKIKFLQQNPYINPYSLLQSSYYNLRSYGLCLDFRLHVSLKIEREPDDCFFKDRYKISKNGRRCDVLNALKPQGDPSEKICITLFNARADEAECYMHGTTHTRSNLRYCPLVYFFRASPTLLSILPSKKYHKKKKKKKDKPIHFSINESLHYSLLLLSIKIDLYPQN